jgi:hypothetical protein
VGKPYCLSHPSFVIKNARPRGGIKSRVMHIEGWPGLIAPLFDNKDLGVVKLMVAK